MRTRSQRDSLEHVLMRLAISRRSSSSAIIRRAGAAPWSVRGQTRSTRMRYPSSGVGAS